MIATQYPLRGGKIVAGVAIALTLSFATIVWLHGFNEPAARISIRLTARTSCLLFVCAFVASSLSFGSASVRGWLRQNRRYVGLSMAVSHGFHAIGIIALAFITTGRSYQHDWGAILGYVFIGAMSATSFPQTANLLGDRAWKILHGVGMYYLWIAFMVAFVKKLPVSLPIYLPFVSLLAIAMIVRLSRYSKSIEFG